MLTESDGLDFTLGGISIRPSDPYTILYRASTDNDRVMLGLKDGMQAFACQREEVVSIEKNEGSAVITTRIKCKGKVFTCTDTYEACSEGILVTSRIHCDKGRGSLPRFGKAFRLDTEYCNVRYYGRNGESYADMKDQTQIEEVCCSVSDMTEPNIKPQESGNRMDTRWAEIDNGDRLIRFTAVDRPFELGIKPYSDKELREMKHREDEKVTGTFVTVSAFQQGIGTGICGPETAPEYRYPVNKDYEMRFIISTEEIEK